MIPCISIQQCLPQTALAKTDISAVPLETALDDSRVLDRHVASCMFHLQALFHYHSVSRCIYTLWYLEVKRKFDISATFFDLN